MWGMVNWMQIKLSFETSKSPKQDRDTFKLFRSPDLKYKLTTYSTCFTENHRIELRD